MDQYRQNTTFKYDKSPVINELKGDQPGETKSFPRESTEPVWKDIWENEKVHNEEAEWCKGVEEKTASIHPQEKVTVTKEKLLNKLKSAKTWWKSPGPDIIHGY